MLEANSFTTSEAVEREVKEYEVENNPILLFIDNVSIDEIINEKTSDVYRRYSVFCAENNLNAMAHTIFSRQLNKRLGLTTKEIRDSQNKKCRIFVEEQ